jgi:hypothetical protein
VRFFAIVALCVLLAVAYGVIHDQVTARVCVEYFTIGHAPIFGTDDPTLLGLAWGVLATWWVGVMLGVPLACVARAGQLPKRDAASLVRPLLLLMAASAVCAVLAGSVGWLLARYGLLYLLEPLASSVPRERHAAYLADLWAHNASYLAGFVGGGFLMLRVWLQRRQAGLSSSPSEKLCYSEERREKAI